MSEWAWVWLCLGVVIVLNVAVIARERQRGDVRRDTCYMCGDPSGDSEFCSDRCADMWDDVADGRL